MIDMLRVAKSVLAGTVAGAFLPLLVLVPNFLGSFGNPAADPAGAAALMTIPIGLSFVLACIVLLVLVVPVSVLLRRIDQEGALGYAFAGMLIGSGAIALVFGRNSGLVALLGGFNGAVTGYVWGATRLKISAYQMSND